jgi:hypothetical protein
MGAFRAVSRPFWGIFRAINIVAIFRPEGATNSLWFSNMAGIPAPKNIFETASAVVGDYWAPNAATRAGISELLSRAAGAGIVNSSSILEIGKRSSLEAMVVVLKTDSLDN